MDQSALAKASFLGCQAQRLWPPFKQSPSLLGQAEALCWCSPSSSPRAPWRSFQGGSGCQKGPGWPWGLPLLLPEGRLRSKEAGGCGRPFLTFFCCSPGIFQCIKQLFLTEQAGRVQAVDFLRKNVANSISMANLVMGLSSVLCSLNGYVGAQGGGGEGDSEPGLDHQWDGCLDSPWKVATGQSLLTLLPSSPLVTRADFSVRAVKTSRWGWGAPLGGGS